MRAYLHRKLRNGGHLTVPILLLMLIVPTTGCSHTEGSPTSATSDQLKSPARTLAIDKVKETAGDYTKLSPEERNQLNLATEGHGKMIFDQAKKLDNIDK